MNPQAYENWTELAKTAQEPFQAIAELNFKTLQNLSYLKPEELIQIKKPEELIEKQIQVAVENGHKALDYIQKSFEIVEKSMLGFVQKGKKVVEGKKGN